MNTPSPVPAQDAATPQKAPTAFGILQSLATGWLAYKGGAAIGLSPGESMIVASGVVSTFTSVIHKYAQKWHLESITQ